MSEYFEIVGRGWAWVGGWVSEDECVFFRRPSLTGTWRKKNKSSSSTNKSRRKSYAIPESACLFGVSGGRKEDDS